MLLYADTLIYNYHPDVNMENNDHWMIAAMLWIVCFAMKRIYPHNVVMFVLMCSKKYFANHGIVLDRDLSAAT